MAPAPIAKPFSSSDNRGFTQPTQWTLWSMLLPPYGQALSKPQGGQGKAATEV